MIKAFIKRLLCKHNELEFIRNVYGDEINLIDARSIWQCKNCGKTVLSDKLLKDITSGKNNN